MPTYATGPRSQSHEANLEEFTTQRALSLRVPCPTCRAVAGVVCRNDVTEGPLRRFAAHTPRLKAARKQETA